MLNCFVGGGVVKRSNDNGLWARWRKASAPFTVALIDGLLTSKKPGVDEKRTRAIQCGETFAKKYIQEFQKLRRHGIDYYVS